MKPSAEASFVSEKFAGSGRAARPPVKIIAVDDDEYFREMLANELEAHDFAVETYPDPQSLLKSVATVAAADIIVLDWKMPGLSGIELLPQLRDLGVNLPVIFLTGQALTGNEMLAFEHGAMD